MSQQKYYDCVFALKGEGVKHPELPWVVTIAASSDEEAKAFMGTLAQDSEGGVEDGQWLEPIAFGCAGSMDSVITELIEEVFFSGEGDRVWEEV